MRAVRIILPVVAGVVMLASPAVAQSVRLLGDFQDWSAYSASQGAGQLCFAMSKPRNVQPQTAGGDETYLYLTNRPGENVRNELNFVAGYTMAPEQKAVLSIGGARHDLFVEGDSAWLDDPAAAETVAGQMRAGATLVIESTNQNGETITQTFSLSGATAASRAIDNACG